MIVKLLTDHHLEFLSLTGGCRGSPESTQVKMPHCLKSHAMAKFVTLRRKDYLLVHVFQPLKLGTTKSCSIVNLEQRWFLRTHLHSCVL